MTESGRLVARGWRRRLTLEGHEVDLRNDGNVLNHEGHGTYITTFICQIHLILSLICVHFSVFKLG